MKKKFKIELVCEKCGGKQDIDRRKSIKNWKVFPNVPCKCGGTFKLKLYEKF